MPLRRTAPLAATRGGPALRRGRVAGFDLTFSAPKSVPVAWAMADGPTRERIYAGHQQALEFVIGYGEREVFTTRTGRGGVVSEPVRGVLAGGFDHWDSRAGDPQLHTHVVVLNSVAGESLWPGRDLRISTRVTKTQISRCETPQKMPCVPRSTRVTSG